jgi:hypothetical protein
MNLIFAGRPLDPLIEQLRSRSCTIEVLPLERIVEILREESASRVVDAIVASHIMHSAPPHVATPGAFYTFERRDKLKGLPDDVAMLDGRKWKSIPFVVLKNAERNIRFEDASDFHPDTIRYASPDEAYRHIRSIVTDYRQRLLSELDNLGFLVRYEHGRYRVGPALGQKRVIQDGTLYSGAHDKRFEGGKSVLTVDRDLYGIQYEVELLEALLNRSETTEAELQGFFQEHPHFLIPNQLFRVLPHVRLMEETKLLIPDFIVKPVVAAQKDSEWEVLDLKRPTAKLLVGKANRARLSHEVMNAIAQLRDYADYFRNPQNALAVSTKLGHKLRFPKLAVLVGRMNNLDLEAFALAQERERDVRIVTYDEILERQKLIAPL